MEKVTRFSSNQECIWNDLSLGSMACESLTLGSLGQTSKESGQQPSSRAAEAEPAGPTWQLTRRGMPCLVRFRESKPGFPIGGRNGKSQGHLLRQLMVDNNTDSLLTLFSVPQGEKPQGSVYSTLVNDHPVSLVIHEENYT